MVDIEVRDSEPGTQQTESTILDVNEIMRKVGAFIDSLRRISQGSGGPPVAVSVEAFNFSLGKFGGEYTLTLKLNLTFKPKPKQESECFVFQ